MKPLKKLKNIIVPVTKPFATGKSNENSNLQKHKVCTEDITFPSEQLPQENQTSMQESPHQKTKLIPSKTNIPTTSSLKISDLESKEKDFSPFWTKSVILKSKKSWLPVKTDLQDLDLSCCNIFHKSLDTNSQLFQNKNQTPQKNRASISLSSQPVAVGSDHIQKTKTVRIYPTPNQKNEFKKIIGTSRYIFNKCVEYNNDAYKKQKADLFEECKKSCLFVKKGIRCLEKSDDKNYFCSDHIEKGKIKWNTVYNPISLRKKILINNKDLSYFDLWLADTPHDSKELMIRSYCGALKSAVTNFKRGNISNFEIGFKSRKNKKQIFFISSRAINIKNNKLHIFKQKLKTDSQLKVKRIPKITMDQSCSILKENQKYYLQIPYKTKIIKNTPIYDTVSLDPGVRTFQTIYSTDGICGNLNLKNDLLKKLHKKIDTLTSLRKFRKCPLLRTKIKNIISDSHWKIVKFLVSNFNKIIIPRFETSKMVSNKKNTISKKTKSDLLNLSHYKFLQKLKFKSNEYGRELVICEEHYTTKTCGKCGILNHKVGSSKVFKCNSCLCQLDRDMNGARNIYLKND